MFTLLYAGCVPPAEDLVGDGVRPEDDGGDPLQQGLVTCNPRSDTGYRRGVAYPIVVVNADGKPIEVKTANAYHAMQRAAAVDDITLRVVSGFRTMAEQEYLYGCYINCACNNCNLAARPGYSNHQSGIALDLNTAAPGVYRWLANNAARFGFVETVPGENWHWEYLNARNFDGPCDDGGNPASQVSFISPQDGGRYQNGLWLKIASDEPVHRVRYSADGYFMGYSEEATDDFSLRYTFSSLGSRVIRAEAFDVDNRSLGQTEITVEITDGVVASQTVHFDGLENDGWYRNGLDLKTTASEGVAEVRYFAGAFELGRSTDRASSFARRYTFGTMGYRALRAIGYDAAGQEVARRDIGLRVLPGAEGPVSVELIAPDVIGTHSRSGVNLRAVASDSIVRVAYSADGWALNQSEDASGNFPITYSFSQGGLRRIKVEGFNAQGALVASKEFSVRLTP